MISAQEALRHCHIAAAFNSLYVYMMNYSLIHSSSIDPALPLPQDHILDLMEPQHSWEETDNGSQVCLFTESREKL